MTDNEIIKALECCNRDDCDNCPNCLGNCYANLAGDALDLINRQKAEIEEYKVVEKHVTPFFFMNAFDKHIEKAKSEAVKEFAERLKQTMEDFARMDFRGSTYFCVGLHHIDNLVKEFTEGKTDE